MFYCQSKPDINAAAHSVHLDSFMAKKLETEILDQRREKDEYFRTSTDSPLPVELRPMFSGLEYYPLDWKYRFEGPVHRYPDPEKFMIVTTSGEKREALKYGFVRFILNGKEFNLQVYRLLDLKEKNLLFVPFMDSNTASMPEIRASMRSVAVPDCMVFAMPSCMPCMSSTRSVTAAA